MGKKKKYNQSIDSFDILKISEVAKYLRVDQRTIYRKIKEGKFPFFLVGNRYRFTKRMIDAWIEENTVKKEIDK